MPRRSHDSFLAFRAGGAGRIVRPREISHRKLGALAPCEIPLVCIT
jgi:hypothetical protein